MQGVGTFIGLSRFAHFIGQVHPGKTRAQGVYETVSVNI